LFEDAAPQDTPRRAAEKMPQMKNKMPEIRISLKNVPSDLPDKMKSSILDLLATLDKSNLLPQNIVSICVTDDFQNEIKNSMEEWGIPFSLTKEKEFCAIAKNIYKSGDLDSEIKMVVDAISCQSVSPINVIAGQITMILFGDKLPPELSAIKEVYSNGDPKSILMRLCKDWLPHILARDIFLELGIAMHITAPQVSSYVNFVYRNIKQAHWTYQSSLDIAPLWNTFLKVFGSFITRCIEADDVLQFPNELGPFYQPLRVFITELNKIAVNAQNKEERPYENLIQPFYQIAKCCCLNISFSENAWNVWIIENPKSFFKGKCLDTEKRIVAFSDILGFSNLIEHYDLNPTSDLLSQVKKALDNAIKFSFKFNQKANENSLDLFEYRQFSDCLCLSVPFYDNFDDFLLQSSVIFTTLASYQIALMTSKILIRGGICVGSYYSDQNLIFSGGLVEAAKTDCHGAPPCLIIHNSIISLLKSFEKAKLAKNSICNLLAFDTSTDTAFLNPFGIYKTFDASMNSVLATINSLKGTSKNSWSER
jgi:hypothetical protein